VDSGLSLEAIDASMHDALDDLLAEYRAAGDGSGAEAGAIRNGYPGTEGYIEFWLRIAREGWTERGYVPTDTWILFRDGRALGDLRLRRILTPELERDGGNVGYAVRRSERGKGYATFMLGEACRRAAQLGIARVLLTIETDNAASLRVAEKCGGVVWDDVIADDGETLRRVWIATGPA
jgi:predicted acetyltransferase